VLSVIADFLLAGRNLRRNSQRTLVAVLTVASGIIAFFLAGGFIAWIFQDMREATIRSQLGHIQIVRPGYFEKGIADPYAFLLPADSAEQKRWTSVALGPLKPCSMEALLAGALATVLGKIIGIKPSTPSLK